MRLKNCNAQEFIAGLKGRKVICFGAGSTLIEAEYEVLKIENLEKHIAFFIDNDSKKHGLKYKYRGFEYDIKSVEALNNISVENYILLITCAFYVEIYKQLRDMDSIKEMEYYMYDMVCSYPELDVENFFTKEIEKYPYKEWRKVLQDLQLKARYKGRKCFIIGNGPSLKVEDLEMLKGEMTFAVNRIFKLFGDTDWRPTFYLCTDYLTYGVDHEAINKIDAQLKFIPIERAPAAGIIYDEVTYYNRVVNCVKVKNGEIIRSKEFEFSDNMEEVIWGGQTVLYDALQMAVYMGFSEIYLYGVDNAYKREVLEDGTIIENDVKEDHFCSNYDEGIESISAEVAPWGAEFAFRKAKEECEVRNITIKNATRGGKLEVFERISFEEALKR